MTVTAFILTYGIPLKAAQARQLFSTLPDYAEIFKTFGNNDPYVRDTSFYLNSFSRSLKARYGLDLYIYPHSEYSDYLVVVGHVLGRVESGTFQGDPFQEMSQRIANQAQGEVQQLVTSILGADIATRRNPFAFRLLPNDCGCCS
eukprot:TRINITY_DN3291_c0_g1_i5.p1 TRINITY_DN3291_c0_g1~~TRINITY_DN3291_c0_g1_i5.p1  ORF type:complete len:145 (+),score=18.53 TRINITY_DN3291_c0_g1_i5:60-494(+)